MASDLGKMRLPDAVQRQFAFTAVGITAPLHGELTPDLYAALRAAQFRDAAYAVTLDP